jgi:hypothetical protein
LISVSLGEQTTFSAVLITSDFRAIFFTHECSQEMVRLCGRRVVLFDNRTKDRLVQAGQRKELFDYVDSIIIKQRSFSDQLHTNIKAVSVHNLISITPVNYTN